MSEPGPKVTWRQLLADSMAYYGDQGSVVAFAPDEGAFDRPFENRFGGVGGEPVLAWTATRVYFGLSFNGLAVLGSAPRDPQPDVQDPGISVGPVPPADEVDLPGLADGPFSE